MPLTKIQEKTLATMPLNEEIERRNIKINTLQCKIPPVGTMLALQKLGFVCQTKSAMFSDYNRYMKVKEVGHAS